MRNTNQRIDDVYYSCPINNIYSLRTISFICLVCSIAVFFLPIKLNHKWTMISDTIWDFTGFLMRTSNWQLTSVVLYYKSFLSIQVVCNQRTHDKYNCHHCDLEKKSKYSFNKTFDQQEQTTRKQGTGWLPPYNLIFLSATPKCSYLPQIAFRQLWEHPLGSF